MIVKRFVTLGIWYDDFDEPGWRLWAIVAESEADAIAIAEEHGNVPRTTKAWEFPAFLALANDLCHGEPDHVQGETNIVRAYNPEAGERIVD